MKGMENGSMGIDSGDLRGKIGKIVDDSEGAESGAMGKDEIVSAMQGMMKTMQKCVDSMSMNRLSVR